MSNKQIGWGREEILLWGLSKKLERLMQVISVYGGGGGGGVSSVSAGTGMAFTTITSSGAVSIDTTRVPYFASPITGTASSSTYLRGDGSWQTISAGGVSSVSGTTNRITSTGGSTPVIDISATFEALLGKVANRIDQNNAATTSAQLASVISDETGTGSLVFGTSPTLVSPALGTPTALVLTNATGLPVGSITGTGTGVLTALATNIGSAGAFVIFNGALGTPSSGIATNLTGIAAGLTAGTVTTNANLTGAITSVGNTTSLGSFTWTAFSSAVTGTSPYWALTGTSTLTGATTITNTIPNGLTVNGAITTTANNQFGLNLSRTTTLRATANDEYSDMLINFTGIASSTGQTLNALNIVVGTTTGGTSPSTNLLKMSYGGNTAAQFDNLGNLVFGPNTGPGYIGPSTSTGAASISGRTMYNRGWGNWSSSSTVSHLFHVRSSTAATGGPFIGFHISTPDASHLNISGGSITYTFFKPEFISNVTSGTNTVVLADFTPTITSDTGTSTKIGLIQGNASYNSGFGTTSPTATLHVVGSTKLQGSLTLPVAGNGLLIKEGSNSTMGTATLIAGTLLITNTKVTATSRIFLQRQTDGGTVAASYSITRSAGVSFTITAKDGTGANNTSDTSVIAWVILEPAP